MYPGQSFSNIDSLGGVVIGGSGIISSEELAMVALCIVFLSFCTECLECMAKALRMFDVGPWVCPIVTDMANMHIDAITKPTLFVVSPHLVLEMLLASVLASILALSEVV